MRSRIDAVWRTRGAIGFARFIGSRMFSRRRDAIFDADTTAYAGEGDWSGPGRLLFITPQNAAALLTPNLTAQLSQGEGAAYVDGVRRQDMVLLVVDESGDILHHSFVLFRTRTKAILGERAFVPLFANCATRPSARGQGLYPRVLRRGLRLLGEMGHRRAVINCDPSNAASLRGIEHAGFRLARRTVTWSALSWIAFQTGRDRDGRIITRLYCG